MIRYSKSGSSDTASKMRSQTRFSLQRLNRRNTLFHSPNISGRSCHGVDDPRPKAGALRRGVRATPDAIILDNKFGALLRYSLQKYTHFTGMRGISVFEGIGDPLRHDDTEVDAQIRLQFKGLQLISQRRAMALIVHRRFNIGE